MPMIRYRGFIESGLNCIRSSRFPLIRTCMSAPRLVGTGTGTKNRVWTQVISDVLGIDQQGAKSVITASVPLAEVQHYAADLRSITQGRGVYSMEIDHYEEVPSDTTKKIIEQYEKERAAGS